MSATDTITVGEALPKLASVEPANGPFSVSVTWAAGSRVGRTDIVDLAPMIFTFKVFKPLRDNPELFRSVRVGDWGTSLVWPGNDDLDVGAESVEEMAEEVMTNSEFAAFLKRTGFTLDAAAAQLGIARRLVAYYAKDREIPRYIALACRQLEAERGVSEPSADNLLSDVPGLFGGVVYPAPALGPDEALFPAAVMQGLLGSARLPAPPPTLPGHGFLSCRTYGHVSGVASGIDPVTGWPVPAAGVIGSRLKSR
ncbi:DUF2442 domain-containing protein [Methylobacterium flocculans]|uniref:DUF2442 domain-containing protein n=1 Tax=Methylobacterium flocculans TaxID=2984843 RepID=UPI0021F283BD|nr:DUF2442 domain-containing protein [Methylobacterium sp. FF17]